MNEPIFVTAGGYPLKSERLQELHTAYKAFNALGYIAGDFTIIAGCQLEGTTVKNGFVFINGELLEFRQGYYSEGVRVIIVEENVDRPFKNGQINTVYKIRYATFGTSETSWPWTDFKRPIQTKDIPADLNARLSLLERMAAPFLTGNTPVFWGGYAQDIPPGWVEDTNWRGRMPVGLDVTQLEFNIIGKPGGAKNKTLSIAEMPAHKHDVLFHQSDAGNSNGRLQGGNYEPTPQMTKNTEDVQTTGGGQAFSILNPYRVVLFIKYVGI